VDVVNKGCSHVSVCLKQKVATTTTTKTLNAVKLFKKKVFPDFLLSKDYVNIILFVNRKKSAPPLFFVLYSKC